MTQWVGMGISTYNTVKRRKACLNFKQFLQIIK
jgi:hypothetical protein